MNVVRMILTLASGTAITRLVAAGGQLLLAFWLSPAEFGYWAAASSALALILGLRNFGEVNGYLSGRGGRISRVIGVTRRLNLILVFAGILVAGLYWLGGNWQVAMLAGIIALTLPIQADSDVMYAASIRAQKQSWIVVAQAVSALVKIISGVLIAMLTGSAVSIAISAFAFSLVLDLLLITRLKEFRAKDSEQESGIPIRTRATWAINSLLLSFPLQAGFLVAQFIADPALLGLFFFSFQVTLGVSGLISVPLARASLSAMADAASKQRGDLALRLCHFFGAGILVVVACMSLGAPLVGPLVTSQWSSAVPAIVILLATLPARMLAPVLDAYQQSEDKWWQSSGFNFVDAIGSALVALLALSGDILLLVLGFSLWKFLLNAARMLIIFKHLSLPRRILLIVPLLLGAGVIFLAAFGQGASEYVWPLAAIAIGCVWLGFVRMRRDSGAMGQV